MSEGSPEGPVLFCYDGSDGSLGAMRAAGQLVARPAEAIVLTVWETLATQLARAGAFAAGTIGGAELDDEEETFAKSVAEDGARLANEHGFTATPMTVEAIEGNAHAILQTADALSVRLIVCGQRGRGPVRAALLGSTSHALASHTRHPVLIAPEHPYAGASSS
jgi:nucleotide-binding universal stress UspA family protein